MKKYIAVLAIIALAAVALISTTAFAATYGKQFVSGYLFGHVDNLNTEVYKINDGTTVCYLAYFGKSGMTMDCVK